MRSWVNSDLSGPEAPASKDPKQRNSKLPLREAVEKEAKSMEAETKIGQFSINAPKH